MTDRQVNDASELSVARPCGGPLRWARARAGHDRAGTVVLLAAGIGFVVRAAVTLVWARWPIGLSDPVRYVGYSVRIADGEGLVDPFTLNPSAYFPPGYPYVLGALRWVARPLGLEDSFPQVLGVAQAAVGAASIVMVGMLGRRIGGGRVGAASAVIVALLPNLVAHSVVALSETLATALMLAFLLVAVPAEGGDLARGRLAGAGLLFGALLLVRPVLAGVVAAAVVAWVAQRPGARTVVVRTISVVAVAALCVLPWTIRNALRLDALVPISTNTGDNLCIGHAPDAEGDFDLFPECRAGPDITDGVAGEVAADRTRRDRAVEFALDRWRDQPGLVGARLRYLVRDDHDAIWAMESYSDDAWMPTRARNVLFRVSDGLWWTTGLVGLAGLVRLVRARRPDGLALVVAVGAVFASPLLTFGDARFKVPAVPLLVIAAVAMTHRGLGRDGYDRGERGA